MSNTKVYLTRHSQNRFDERTDFVTAERQKLANKAFNSGHIFSCFKEPVYSYLKSISYDDGKYVAKVFEDYVYIFNNCNGHRLLTVYKVPEEYLPVDQYLIAKDELKRCGILLVSKAGNETYYWSEYGTLTKDIDLMLEFTSQIKANNYINNNNALDNYKDDYDIRLF